MKWPASFYQRFWLTGLIINIVLFAIIQWQWPWLVIVFIKGSLLGAMFWLSIQLRTRTLQPAVEHTRLQTVLNIATPALGILSMVGIAWLLAQTAGFHSLRLGVVITGFFSYNVNVLSELCFSVWRKRNRQSSL